MPLIQETDFVAILRVLSTFRVDFIVVGGIAAVLNGVPLMTFDLDLVHSREVGNVTRLRAAFECLKPAQESDLASARHQQTRFGPLDLLGAIGQGHTYEDLLHHCHEMLLDDELSVRVLDLEAVIAEKEVVGGEKDCAALPLLRRTLAERNRNPG